MVDVSSIDLFKAHLDNLYRTIQFSAKHGLAIACHPSVCLSVRLWRNWRWWFVITGKSWKLIARAISPTPSLFAAKGRSTYSQGKWGSFGETRSGWWKMAFCRTKAAISLKRVKMEEKLLWRAYRNSPTLFRTVPSQTPYGFPFLEIGGLQLSYPLLSQERVKLQTSNFAGTLIGSIGTKAHEKCWE